MKINKTHIILIILVLFLVIIGFVANSTLKEKEPATKPQIKITFLDVEEINYHAYNLEDFIADVICTEEICFIKGEKITYDFSDVTGLGPASFTVKIEVANQKYEHTFDVEVVDKIAPMIELTNEEVTLSKDSQFNPGDYLKNITDNYGTINPDNVKIENNVNPNVAGNYEVTYEITDENGNVARKTLPVTVQEDSNVTEPTTTQVTTKTTSTTKEVKTSATSTKTTKKTTTTKPTSNSTFKSNVNATKLTPIKTRDSEFDNEIDQVLNGIIKDSMSNYDKLVAIFQYVMKLLDYQMVVTNLADYQRLMENYQYGYADARVILLAMNALHDKYGVCDSYASLFVVLSRRVGFETYYVGGSVKKVGGGTTGHAWVNIKANGKWYNIDPQIADSKKDPMVYFGKTDSQINIYTYNRTPYINEFNNFKKLNAYNTSITIPELDIAETINTYYYTSVRKENLKLQVNDKITINTKANYTSKIVVSISDPNYDYNNIEVKNNMAEYNFNTAGIYTIYVRLSDSLYGRDTELELEIEVLE